MIDKTQVPLAEVMIDYDSAIAGFAVLSIGSLKVEVSEDQLEALYSTYRDRDLDRISELESELESVERKFHKIHGLSDEIEVLAMKIQDV